MLGDRRITSQPALVSQSWKTVSPSVNSAFREGKANKTCSSPKQDENFRTDVGRS